MQEPTAPPGATAPVFYEQEEHAHGDGGTLIGFWMYLMSDSLIFAALFATFGVLGRNYAAGPSGAGPWSPPTTTATGTPIPTSAAATTTPTGGWPTSSP